MIRISAVGFLAWICYYISSSFANSDPLPSTSCANCAAWGEDPITEIRYFGFYSQSSIKKQSVGRIVMGKGAVLCDREPVLLREKVTLNKTLIFPALLHCKRIVELPKPIDFFIYLQVLAGRRTHPCRIPLLGWNHPMWDVDNWAGITPDQLSKKSCEKGVAFPGLHLWEQSLMHTEPSRPPPSSAISFHC